MRSYWLRMVALGAKRREYRVQENTVAAVVATLDIATGKRSVLLSRIELLLPPPK